ncbi:MAG: heavy metal translocating P-type ATPase [Lachnospiraceae bacterium]|nr:heavy metal translocating P-type ATPase [Lachnospiraceae bacterium]
MNFQIKHEITGRVRIHLKQNRMSCEQADRLAYFLSGLEGVVKAKVYERTADAVICYQGDRAALLEAVRNFAYERTDVPQEILQTSGRALNAEYREKLVTRVVCHYGRKFLLPAAWNACYISIKSLSYIWKGLCTLWRRKIEVPVLDATAIGVSVFRGECSTASSIMFLLGIGEILEEWTHKKSVDDLARSMSLNIGKVWVKSGGQEILVPASDVKAEDLVVIHMGNVVPFDGTVEAGEAMINQASLTGESVPVARAVGGTVYAGTVVEEGEITIRVKTVGGSSRFEKIVTMIEESEKLKSGLESKAEHLADRLVPYTLAGTGLIYLLTRNVTRALSVLMVDFSCALKLAMPISVLSAIREAGDYKITVKGGKYLEEVAEADTIVFDKTGTLTKAKPTVAKVIPFNGGDPDELLRLAACMEEHFPHSMAKAVVNAAKERHLDHEEVHSKVEYIVAHGISTQVEGKKAIIGSHHFVFEDEGCRLPEGTEELFASLPEAYSHLYLAIEQELAAVICIEDPLREEAREAVRLLKEAGLNKVVMMTGDSERTARAIAARVGVDTYYSEVLPEDKANFVEQEKREGRKVIMIGDGINDSPALSAANVGIAISDGAEIAREIADITVGADDLMQIVTLRYLSRHLMGRIRKNYQMIVGINTLLILLGVGGVIQPTASALLHNTSTLAIGLKNMQNLL